MDVTERLCSIGSLKDGFCEVSGRTDIEIRSGDGYVHVSMNNHPSGEVLAFKTDKPLILRIFSYEGYLEKVIDPRESESIEGQYLGYYFAVKKTDNGVLLGIFSRKAMLRKDWDSLHLYIWPY